VELWLGTTRLGVVGLAAAVLTLAAAVFLDFPAAGLEAAEGFGLRLLRPGRLPGSGHFRLLGSFRDWLGRVIWSREWSGSLDDTPPSDYVIPPLAQIRLLGRGPGPLLFRSGRVGCGGGPSATIGRLLCKRGLCFFPLHTAPVVRRVVSPTATAQGLFLQGRAASGEMGAPTRDARGCVTAVSLRVSKALAALALQWALRGHVRLHRHSQTAEFGDRSYP
jgi:hypothetical protein